MTTDKEKKRVYNKEYRASHQEEYKAYYELHKNDISSNALRRYHENKNNLAEKRSNYKKAHKKEISIYARKYRYKISPEDYNNLLLVQGGVCAICGKPPKNNTGLCVDHNHVTNKVRGLLCVKCNVMLGMSDDKIEIFKKAIEYLARS